MLFLDGADGDAEPVGDFLVGQQFDFSQQQYVAAAGGQLSDGLLELLQFLARHYLLDHARCRRGRSFGFECLAREGRDATALESVDGQPAGGGV